MSILSRKFILIGCGKAKRSEACEAQDLYVGSLFRARRAYAEASGHLWMILSAEHDVMWPSHFIEPYNRTMKDLTPGLRIEWGKEVAWQLFNRLVTEVEIHAGTSYVYPLTTALSSSKISWTWPVCGMSQGHQLQWYKQQREKKWTT